MIPQIQITDQGILAPSRQEISEGLWSMMRTAFGQTLREDPRTPQGQLVTSLTAMIDEQNWAMIEQANNFDPRYAEKQYQDALAAIYFINRQQSTRSVAQLSFTGLPDVVIPRGFVVIDTQGREWVTTIRKAVGEGLVNAECSTPGPVFAAPNTITAFKETIDGLDRVTNPEAAAVGTLEESRSQFEERRFDSVAINGWGMDAVVGAAVSNIKGVIDCYAYSNKTDQSITHGFTNYPMIRNSLLVSVVGGDDYEVADMVLRKGGTGCAFVGNTALVVTDELSGNGIPPTYDVTFLRPEHVTVAIKVSLLPSGAITTDTYSEIKKAIVERFTQGASRARIASVVAASSFMCAINIAGVQVASVRVSIDGSSWEEVLRFGVDQYPVTSLDSVSVEIV